MSDDEQNKINISMIVGAVQAEVKIFTKQQAEFQTTMFQLYGDLKKDVTQRIDNTLASLPCSERAERLVACEAKANTTQTIVHELAKAVQDHEQTLTPIKEEREKEEETVTAQEEEKKGIRIEVKSALYITAIMGLFKLAEKFWPFG